MGPGFKPFHTTTAHADSKMKIRVSLPSKFGWYVWGSNPCTYAFKINTLTAGLGFDGISVEILRVTFGQKCCFSLPFLKIYILLFLIGSLTRFSRMP